MKLLQLDDLESDELFKNSAYIKHLIFIKYKYFYNNSISFLKVKL